MDHFPDIVLFLSQLSALLPLILFFVTYKRQIRFTKQLGLYLMLSFAADILGSLFFEFRINTNYAGNSFTLFQFFLFSLIFKELLLNRHQGYRWAGLLGYILAFGFLVLWFGLASPYFKYLEVYSGIFFISLSVFYFFYLMNELPAENLKNLPGFWFNIGILFFFSGNLMLFISYNFLSSNKDLLNLWMVHNFLNFLKNFIFGGAIYLQFKFAKQEKSLS